ncbi:hypothetical protein JW905_00920 [bacterium]|nr:hypothetical protein [candidate division CSSED10-310 bacterium]
MPLRRSRLVYLLLLVMAMLLAIPGVGIVFAFSRGLPIWVGAILCLILLTVWIPLTNYLGYRLVGWIPAGRVS